MNSLIAVVLRQIKFFSANGNAISLRRIKIGGQ